VSSVDEIVESIEGHLGELRAEIRSLEAAHQALGSNGDPRARTRVAGKVNVGRRKSPSARRPQAADGTAARPSATEAEVAAVVQPGIGRSPRTRRRVAARLKRTMTLSGEGLRAILRESPEGLSAVAIAQRANVGDGQVRGL
jgi:hypothetical protein